MAEILKNGIDKMTTMITELIKRCLLGESVSEEWKVRFMSSIHKKGDRLTCENYRGITVTSTLRRLYGRTLRDIIKEEYKEKEAEERSGFHAGKFCMDNIFYLKQIIEKNIAIGIELHLLFIDLSKADDNIPIGKLRETLEQTNISYTIIKAVKNLYKGST